jgi:hypothetical protein
MLVAFGLLWNSSLMRYRRAFYRIQEGGGYIMFTELEAIFSRRYCHSAILLRFRVWEYSFRQSTDIS